MNYLYTTILSFLKKPEINMDHVHELKKIAYKAKQIQLNRCISELEILKDLQKEEEEFYLLESLRENDLRLNEQLNETFQMILKLKKVLKKEFYLEHFNYDVSTSSHVDSDGNSN